MESLLFAFGVVSEKAEQVEVVDANIDSEIIIAAVLRLFIVLLSLLDCR